MNYEQEYIRVLKEKSAIVKALDIVSVLEQSDNTLESYKKRKELEAKLEVQEQVCQVAWEEFFLNCPYSICDSKEGDINAELLDDDSYIENEIYNLTQLQAC